jgi:hypothetical protein
LVVDPLPQRREKDSRSVNIQIIARTSGISQMAKEEARNI